MSGLGEMYRQCAGAEMKLGLHRGRNWGREPLSARVLLGDPTAEQCPRCASSNTPRRREAEQGPFGNKSQLISICPWRGWGWVSQSVQGCLERCQQRLLGEKSILAGTPQLYGFLTVAGRGQTAKCNVSGVPRFAWRSRRGGQGSAEQGQRALWVGAGPVVLGGDIGDHESSTSCV